jgi:selenocysteine-specific elongation factor
LATGPLDAVLAESVRQSSSWAVPFAAMQRFANRPESDVRAALAAATGLRPFDLDGEVVYSTVPRWEAAKARVVSAVDAHHAAQPLAPGMEMEPLREGLPGPPSPRLFRAMIDALAADGSVVREGSLLRRPTHAVRLDDAQARLVHTLADLLGRTPFSPPDLKQLERDAAVPKPKLLEVLRVMEREKRVVRVSPELYFLPDALERMQAGLRGHLRTARDITPATFRDLFDTSRKYAIPLLEYFDRTGITVRVGDVRRLRG